MFRVVRPGRNVTRDRVSVWFRRFRGWREEVSLLLLPSGRERVDNRDGDEKFGAKGGEEGKNLYENVDTEVRRPKQSRLRENVVRFDYESERECT